MAQRGFGSIGAGGTLAACALLTGCTFALWDRPQPQPAEAAVEEDGGGGRSVLTGILTGPERVLPDAVQVAGLREASVERAFGGVILRVTGIAPTQGYFNAMLRPENGGQPDAAGIMTVTLVAVPPPAPEAVGPERTRLLLAGAFLQDRDLRDIRGFRVVAGGTSQTLPLPQR